MVAVPAQRVSDSARAFRARHPWHPSQYIL